MAGTVESGLFRYSRYPITLTTHITLTADEQKNGILEFGGTPGAACTVTLTGVPDGYAWILYNACGDDVTLKVSGQTGVTVATTKRALVYCDGTDVRRVTPDT